MRRLSFRDPAEQLADKLYARPGELDPTLVEAGVRQLGATRDLMEGLILGLVRGLPRAGAELMVAELGKVLGRPLPEVAADAPAKEVPVVQARVLLDGVPKHQVLQALLVLNALHSAQKDPWLARHEEIQSTAAELLRLHERLTHKRDRWQKDLDHTVEALERVMKT